MKSWSIDILFLSLVVKPFESHRQLWRHHLMSDWFQTETRHFFFQRNCLNPLQHQRFIWLLHNYIKEELLVLLKDHRLQFKSKKILLFIKTFEFLFLSSFLGSCYTSVVKPNASWKCFLNKICEVSKIVSVICNLIFELHY